MNKFITLMAAMLLSMSAFAQTTVLGSKTFENTYTSIEAGVTTPMTDFSVRPLTGIEFGKDFTPVVGASVEALGLFNTTGSQNIFDQSVVAGNFKVNMSNWIGGYKGTPRRVEVLAVPSIGWGHDYNVITYDNNYLVFNPYTQVNFNLGKERALQVSVKVGPNWKLDNYQLNSNLGSVNARVNVAWKFGSKSKKSHNFVASPYTVTKADYDAALARITELEGRAPQTVEVVKEVPVEKIVKDTITNNYSTMTIPFSIGRYELTKAEKALVKSFVFYMDPDTLIQVIGSADLSTGSKDRNEFIAKKRAENVVNVLKENGMRNIESWHQFDPSDVIEASRSAIIIIR